MKQRVYEHEPTPTAYQSTLSIEEIRAAYMASYGLTLLQPVLIDRPGQAMLDLLRLLSEQEPDPVAVATIYSHTFRELVTVAQDRVTYQLPPLSDTWQAYIIARLLDTTTLWSEQAERLGNTGKLSATLQAQARRDLRALQRLFRLDASALLERVQTIVAPTLPVLQEAWEPWYELTSTSTENALSLPARDTLAQQAATTTDWADLVPELEHYWSRHGTGILAHYRILRWEGAQQRLVGIVHPDQIQLTNLIGQQRQQSSLSINIERFLAGLPAHDMLLYGPPGTGKSSTIKALVNAYAAQGLRLAEIRRDDIADLPQIITQLRVRAPRYLLFIDDLSFEEHETAYKILKVLLEGTAEARPRNILICATSNRMNLIRENFSERGKPTQDVNWHDTRDEKQSLAHRFGLRVTFITPDQQQYLTIISELARQRGLDIAEDVLHTRALQWERLHAGRSGRTARQFIDDLEAELNSTFTKSVASK